MKKCKYCMSEIDDKAKICPHCGKRQKRSVIKTILSCIFLLFVVLVIIAIATGGGDKDEAGIMTMDKFNTIQNGMTYEEVVEIVGGEGELSNTAGDGEYKIELYSWDGNGNVGSNANVTFTNGKVSGKAQLGLEASTGSKASTYETKRDLFENDNLKVTFLKAYEDDNAKGMLYLQLNVENNYKQRITVMLENPVVNGYNTTTLGAIPMEIDSGAQNKTPFIYNEENVSIDKLDDLKNIKFNITIYDSETMSNLFTSEQIVIDFEN